MTTTTKAIISVSVVIGAVGAFYFLSKKKSIATAQLAAIGDVDSQLKAAMNSFSSSSPVGATENTLTKAEIDKGYAYLGKTLSTRQKQMFIDYSKSFMAGVDKYATSAQAQTNVDSDAMEGADLQGMFKVMADTQDLLEKKYGKTDADAFMKFMNNFDPKKI